MMMMLLLFRLTLNRSLKLDSLNHQLLQFTVFLLLVLPGALA